jgi:Fungal Zn(2)-Cys(6) binuclear cluster domain.
MVETSPQEAGLGNKRRELRKGTQSCWECKRRKVRCIFVSTHSTCNHCRRRGTTCIGQEYPDKPNPSRGAQVEPRLNRVEDILEQLVANAETAHVQKSAPENRLESHATLGTRGNGARFWQETDRVVSLPIRE